MTAVVAAPAPTVVDWRQRAACAAPDVDPEWFFPEPGHTANLARQVCARCPVKAPCLADALAWSDEHGIRGGLTPRERRRLRERTR